MIASYFNITEKETMAPLLSQLLLNSFFAMCVYVKKLVGQALNQLKLKPQRTTVYQLFTCFNDEKRAKKNATYAHIHDDIKQTKN